MAKRKCAQNGWDEKYEIKELRKFSSENQTTLKTGPVQYPGYYSAVTVGQSLTLLLSPDRWHLLKARND